MVKPEHPSLGEKDRERFVDTVNRVAGKFALLVIQDDPEHTHKQASNKRPVSLDCISF